MNLLEQLLSLALLLVIILALASGGYVAVEYFITLYRGLDAQLAGVTAIASVVLLAASLIVASAIRQLARRGRASGAYAEKVSTYRSYVEVWSSLFQQRRPEGLRAPVASPDARPKLNRSLALYASPAVLKANAGLIALAERLGIHTRETEAQFTKVLLEVRRDLGMQVRGIDEKALQGLLFPDSGHAGAPDMPRPPGFETEMGGSSRPS